MEIFKNTIRIKVLLFFKIKLNKQLKKKKQRKLWVVLILLLALECCELGPVITQTRLFIRPLLGHKVLKERVDWSFPKFSILCERVGGQDMFVKK